MNIQYGFRVHDNRKALRFESDPFQIFIIAVDLDRIPLETSTSVKVTEKNSTPYMGKLPSFTFIPISEIGLKDRKTAMKYIIKGVFLHL